MAESAHAVALEIGDRKLEWRALQFLGEFGIAADAVEVAVPWLEQALELARREGFAAFEAIGVHSLAVARWIGGDLPGADRLLTDSVERFLAREGSADTIPSPLSIAEIRTAPACGPDRRPARLRRHAPTPRRDLLRRRRQLRACESGRDRPRPR